MKAAIWTASALLRNTTDPDKALWSCELSNGAGGDVITIGTQSSQSCIDLMREVKNHLNSPKGATP